MKEDNQLKGIKNLSEKFAKVMIRLFEILSIDDSLEKFNQDVN